MGVSRADVAASFEQAVVDVLVDRALKAAVETGVSDLVVVQLEDIVVVCPRERVGELRRLREELGRRGREDLL